MTVSKDSNKTKRSYSKYRRLPNGFGQISKIKGNLRNPFRAMVTVGKTPTGKPICKLLKPKAYFRTYNDAYQALMKYHEDPINLYETITCQELYDKWSAYRTDMSEKNRKRYDGTWKYCSEIYDTPFVEIRPKHIRHCILEGKVVTKNGKVKTPPPNVQSSIKVLWNLMFDYALEQEIVNRNYARDMAMPKQVSENIKASYKGHTSLSDDDLLLLKANLENIHSEIAYVQCYMGWRPNEILNIKTCDVDLENMTITGGSKTVSGRNRIVPIHPAIQNIIKERYNSEHEKLYDVKYETYKYNFNLVLPEHRPHDCRKTFITRAKEHGMNEYAIKRIVGHAIKDITESLYTDRSIDWLRTEICKIPTL